MFNFIKTHKVSILSMLLVIATAVLGAGGCFAMAETVVPADAPNPGGEGVRGTEPGGMENRPAAEQPKPDLAGLNTVLPGKAATATDVRDAGLEAEDYDREVVEFNKFKYASETLLASKVKPVKVSSYIVQHFRIGQPDLDAVVNLSSEVVITKNTKSFNIPSSDISNAEALTVNSTVIVEGVDGYITDANGNEITDGALQLYVIGNTPGGNVQFYVQNGPKGVSTSITLDDGENYKFIVCATAASESQMKTAPITFLPEKSQAVLQKKIASTIITDEFKEQIKKNPIGMGDVIKYVTDIFKRECARTHWLGQEGRVDLIVPETGGRENAYTEKGILRQIPMLYTHAEDLTKDDLMAISSMMFTEYAQSDHATAFVGTKEMKRLMKLINSATQYKDVSTVEVSDYGIKIRKYSDNFGTIDFVHDQTLTELGYSDAMVVLDLSSMVRYYKVEDKIQTQDMKNTGEAREAERWNICRTDCYCLKGGNAILVMPTSAAKISANLGGITSKFTTASTITDETDKSKKYYLTADITIGSNTLKAGTIVEYDKDLESWVQFTGRIFV